MEFNEEILKRQLRKYKFRDLTLKELKDVHKKFPELKSSLDTYTFSDGSQKELLNVIGTIPVRYQGSSYNIPIRIWILDSHPFGPPLCFLSPTSKMVIRVGKHVDTQGRIYLPYLQHWSYPKMDMIGLLSEIITNFEEETPLYMRPSADGTLMTELNTIMANISSGLSNVSPQPKVQAVDQQSSKVTVLGGGDLGLACTMSILAKDIVEKLVFISTTENAMKSGTLDMEIFHLPKVEISKDYSKSADSDVVIITANTWTVEVMTYVSWKLSGFPSHRVIGTGCNLDTRRFQFILGKSRKISPAESEAWIIGEHGDNEVSVWKGLEMHDGQNINSDIITDHDKYKQLAHSAFKGLKEKSQRSWSLGLSVADLTETILRKMEHSHSVTTLVKGWYGISSEVFLSLPCVLTRAGVVGVSVPKLVEEDEEKLQRSAATLQNFLKQLKI
ncbi:ubiquitin-conjugating enzyme E2 variant 3 isoform X2 [Narcine bancroftii]|uniref:ubiquitin-conjugating enzyme E2 variant 3 isoform X2 n=1 Tax=Narcine bancroftii TaxID=1343680 RepID=UPI003831DCE7